MINYSVELTFLFTDSQTGEEHELIQRRTFTFSNRLTVLEVIDTVFEDNPDAAAVHVYAISQTRQQWTWRHRQEDDQ